MNILALETRRMAQDAVVRQEAALLGISPVRWRALIEARGFCDLACAEMAAFAERLYSSETEWMTAASTR